MRTALVEIGGPYHTIGLYAEALAHRYTSKCVLAPALQYVMIERGYAHQRAHFHRARRPAAHGARASERSDGSHRRRAHPKGSQRDSRARSDRSENGLRPKSENKVRTIEHSTFYCRNDSLVSRLFLESYCVCTRQGSNLQPYDPKGYTLPFTKVSRRKAVPPLLHGSIR